MVNRVLESIPTQAPKAAVFAVFIWIVGIADVVAGVFFQLAGWHVAYFIAFGFLCLLLACFAACMACLAIQSIFGRVELKRGQPSASGFDLALLVAITNKFSSAAFAAASPLIAALIIYQGGLGSVPIHDGAGQVIGHVNNVFAALVFSSIWLAGSFAFFHAAKKHEAKIRHERDLAGREDQA